jgi:purine nucleosidase
MDFQPQKIIIDTDFATMLDDGQVVAMAAQLHAEGQLDLLGVTVVTGDEWRDQEVAEAVKATERLGVGDPGHGRSASPPATDRDVAPDAERPDRGPHEGNASANVPVGVYPGADYPLDHGRAAVQADAAALTTGDGFTGAWGMKKPTSRADLVAPPDGFAVCAKPRAQRAVDFMADQLRAFPHEITIVAIGPLTDLALLAKEHPDAVGLVKRIVIMGGAFDVPGNSTAKAELNWWFDPKAADEVLKLPVEEVVTPLDLSNTVRLDNALYRRIAWPPRPTAVTDLYRDIVGAGLDGKGGFDRDPDYTQPLWDELAFAYAVDPSFATESRVVWPTVRAQRGENDGSVSYSPTPTPGRRPVTVITKFDNPRFEDWYVDLMTRPVPATRQGRRAVCRENH